MMIAIWYNYVNFYQELYKMYAITHQHHKSLGHTQINNLHNNDTFRCPQNNLSNDLYI